VKLSQKRGFEKAERIKADVRYPSFSAKNACWIFRSVFD
jgi:hypothetical protein